MVKSLKAEFDIFALRKTQGGQRVDTKAQRTRTRSTAFKQNIKPDRTKDNIFLKPKMTETYGERVDDRLEAGYRELKRFGKTQSRWWKQQANLQGDITKESEEMQIEALKGSTRS